MALNELTMKRRYKTGAIVDADRLDVTPEFLAKVSAWTSFYRAYPFVFAEHFLGVQLEMFQKIILYGMMHNQFSMFIASRGKPLPHYTEMCSCKLRNIGAIISVYFIRKLRETKFKMG